MRRSLLLLAAVASAAVAAPVPKKPKAEAADLTALHALIAKRAEKGEWLEGDAAVLEKTIDTLLENVAKATGESAWKLPRDLVTAKMQFKKRDVVIEEPGVYLVNGDASVLTARSVVLATGKVTWIGMEDAVVIARSVRTFTAWNSLLVAAEQVGEIGDNFGHAKNEGKECFVVAGKRIQAEAVYGGYFYILVPEFSDRPKAKPPVSATRVEKNAQLLAEPSDRAVGHKDFKLVELTAPIAK